ncbi:MAG: ABC transporter permease subunit [Oligoflexia bacterium]|nr:ABC transporter permease subunit [Oligoflexia bacterium]
MKYFFYILFIFSTMNSANATESIQIGSKKFTESVILGEIVHLGIQSDTLQVKHIAELGGTRILWNALLAGNIDIYPEYTGTLRLELIKNEKITESDLKLFLKEKGIGITNSIGFNNTYAVAMNKKRAEGLGINKISDLAKFPELKLGWAEEFLKRNDGWPGLKQKYLLPHRMIKGLDHDIAYRALDSGDIDVMDAYSTDASIEHYNLKILTDDKNYFPRYDAVFLYRLELKEKAPEVVHFLSSLEGKISEEKMIELNSAVKIHGRSESAVAANFIETNFQKTIELNAPSLYERLWTRTKEHIYLVAISLFFACIFAIPMGIIAEKHQWTGKVLISIVGIFQTIPALALLVVLIKPLNWVGLRGIGDTPALIALFLYGLLPILRNTHSGLSQISTSLRETASVLGLAPHSKLFKIDLPLALPFILSGIKTSAVMTVGFATLGALVGAGGYGQPILTGIRLDSYSLILEGAIPSAILAILMQLFFELIESLFVSPGLRK